MSAVVDPVSIAAQAEMLQSMETGDGIAVINPGKIPVSYTHLTLPTILRV